MCRKIRGKAIKFASSKEHYPHPFSDLYLKVRRKNSLTFVWFNIASFKSTVAPHPHPHPEVL